MSKRHHRGGTPPEKRAQVAERRGRCIELRLAGATFDQIAQQLGYNSRQAAHVDFTRAVNERIKATRELAGLAIEVEVERLNRAQLAIWPKVLAGDTGAVTVLLKLVDQRARLLGLHAPQQHEVITIDAIDAEIRRLEAELHSRGASTAAEASPAARPTGTQGQG